MFLKRVYKARGDVILGVKKLVFKRHQRFSPKLVSIGQEEGWLLRKNGEIRLRSHDNTETVYKIMRMPGPYCSCGKPIDPRTKIPCCPGRYEVINYFDCLLV